MEETTKRRGGDTVAEPDAYEILCVRIKVKDLWIYT